MVSSTFFQPPGWNGSGGSVLQPCWSSAQPDVTVCWHPVTARHCPRAALCFGAARSLSQHVGNQPRHFCTGMKINGEAPNLPMKELFSALLHYAQSLSSSLWPAWVPPTAGAEPGTAPCPPWQRSGALCLSSEFIRTQELNLEGDAKARQHTSEARSEVLVLGCEMVSSDADVGEGGRCLPSQESCSSERGGCASVLAACLWAAVLPCTAQETTAQRPCHESRGLVGHWGDAAEPCPWSKHTGQAPVPEGYFSRAQNKVFFKQVSYWVGQAMI